jgi:hypothetical protein
VLTCKNLAGEKALVDEKKRRRRGTKIPLKADEKRTHTVSVRLNREELAMLDERRAHVVMQRGEYLRAAGLHQRLPASIPEINREAWASLSRSAANLNQIARKINLADPKSVPSLEDVRETLADFRLRLIGAKR